MIYRYEHKHIDESQNEWHLYANLKITPNFHYISGKRLELDFISEYY